MPAVADPRSAGREGRRRHESPHQTDTRKRPHSQSPAGRRSKTPKLCDEDDGLSVPLRAEASDSDVAMNTDESPAAHAGTAGTQNSALPPPTNKLTSIGAFTQEYLEHVTYVATLRLRREEAKARLDRAKAEYEATQKMFDQFPIIKEQKTSARDRAQKDFDQQDTSLTSHLNARSRLAEDFEHVIGQAVNKRQRTDQDYVSKTEFNELCVALRKAEEHNTERDKRLADAKEGDRLVRVQLAEELESLRKNTRAGQEESKMRESTVHSLQADIARLKAANLDYEASQQQNISALDELKAEIQDMYRKLQSTSRSVSSGTAASTPELRDRLRGMEEAHKGLSERVEELEFLNGEEELAKRDAIIGLMFDEKLGGYKTKDGAFRKYAELSAGVAQVRNDLSQQIQAVETQLHAIASSMQALTSRTDGIERTKAETQVVGEMQGKLNSLGADLKRLKQAPTPVPGADSSNTPSAGGQNGHHAVQRMSLADSPEYGHIQERISGLIVVTNTLEHMYNSLTTDAVVKTMVDQFNRQYPGVKEAHEMTARVHALKLEFDGMRRQWHEAQQQTWREIASARGQADAAADKANRIEETLSASSAR